MKLVIALFLGYTSAVRVSDVDTRNQKDVGIAGYDPWVRNMVHDNVEPYPAIPRSRRNLIPDAEINVAKKKAAEEEKAKETGEDAKKEALKDGDKKEEKKEGGDSKDAPKAEEKKEAAAEAPAPKEGALLQSGVHYSQKFGLWLENDSFLQWSQHDFKGNPERVHILDPVTYQSTANAGSYLGNKRTSFYAQTDDNNMLQWSQHDFAGNPERVHILDPVTYQSTANAGSYLGN